MARSGSQKQSQKLIHHRGTESTEEKPLILLIAPQARLTIKKLCALCASVVKCFSFFRMSSKAQLHHQSLDR